MPWIGTHLANLPPEPNAQHERRLGWHLDLLGACRRVSAKACLASSRRGDKPRRALHALDSAGAHEQPVLLLLRSLALATKSA